MTTNASPEESTAAVSSLPAGTVILDEALAGIARSLTSRAPERGGLLFGPRGQKMVTLFVADEAAEHRPATYTPSPSICLSAPGIEERTGLEYKGIVHSHPGGLDSPSMPDVAAARRALRANPHLPVFLMPIVTLGEFDEEALRTHETMLPGGKISHFLVSANVRRGGAALQPDRLNALSLRGDLLRISGRIPERPEVPKAVLMDIEGVTGPAYTLETGDGCWLFIATPGYPFTPPLVVAPGNRGAVPLCWDPGVPADRRLDHALETSGVFGARRKKFPLDSGMTPSPALWNGRNEENKPEKP